MTAKIQQIDPYRWRIDQDFQPGMRVPGIIYSDEELIRSALDDNAFLQVANVATLPGIQKASLAMPDIHWGYGFPIGGVAAMETHSGVVSPGGVGYDINCGVRILRSDLEIAEVRPYVKRLIDRLFADVPCGVGSRGKIVAKGKDLEKLMVKGSKWAVDNGYGWNEDIDRCEDSGAMPGADPNAVSQKARNRGNDEIGTLGSGNHFLEIQFVEKVFDTELADAFGVFPGQVCVMIHCGSRGFGHQICDEYARDFAGKMPGYGISVPDKQLACAPIDSSDGKEYLSAMACAANYAWANRQAITHLVRESFEQVLGRGASKLGLRLVYDVAHNIAKFEKHSLDGKNKRLLIHRKGATRAFGPGRDEVPDIYRKFGQPVIIPGDMGTASYLLAGTSSAMEQTFGSTCHGAGRVMSRKAAIRGMKGRQIDQELLQKGIYARWEGRHTMLEEAPSAYKSIDRVIDVVTGAGIARRVARMIPVGVVKG
ncbi:MAG: RtcB family protein [bacterium]